MLKIDPANKDKAPAEGTAGALVLVADDDAHIVELVAMYLQRSGYRVEPAYDGSEALRKARELKPDLLVLDIMMPGEDGLQVCRALSRPGGVPIIFLTARTSDVDKIAGLRLGADDYVTKPFNPHELVARVDAVIRRAGDREIAANGDVNHIGALIIDSSARTAEMNGTRLTLTPKEFDLLATMAGFPGVVLDRDQLLDLVWGTSFYAARTVDVHVARLREKIKGAGVRIETVWGTGYRLVEE
jgi:two-component system alkaline phosphatase synthesis response regulator PhoP/two-component system response regulator ResD